jgi:predicted aspartyl protease
MFRFHYLRNRALVLFFALFTSLPTNLGAQMPGIEMARGAKKIEIPFEKQDNFIIVKVLFEGIFPMRFIVDTGAEFTILSKKEIATLFQLPYARTLTIMGTDMRTQITAHIVRKVKLNLVNLTLSKDILVLEEDYFKLDQFVGLNIDGIIGAETFRGYILKIDYEKQILTMYDPVVFSEKDRKAYSEMPITIERGKPYISTQVFIKPDTAVQVKLLLDSGAALALLLHTHSGANLSLPEKVINGSIGSGLGGSIDGVLGRAHRLDIGAEPIKSFICHFQSFINAADTSNISGRNGLIGGDIMSKFHVIIDFSKEKLYLKPNKTFKELFVYDKSGITAIASGILLNIFTISEIQPGSPAHEAGIMKGDEILKINRLPSTYLTLGALNQYFQKKDGKEITLSIKRDKKILKFKFKLRTLI